MSKACLKRFISLSLSLLLLLPATAALGTTAELEFDANRGKLLSYMLRQKLASYHYSQKTLDDQLSEAAFELFLKQLDSQKRFLLKQDAELLEGYSRRIDDEINSGLLELPLLGAEIFHRRLPKVDRMVKEILQTDFDFNAREGLQTDPDKLAFCTTDAELKERWRRTLKYQVITRYLNLLEDEGIDSEQQAAPEKLAELRQQAREKIRNSQENFFTRMARETTQDHFDRYLNAITRAFDPHTNYLPPTQKEDFDISMRGSLEGIGATLREEDGYIKVVRVIPGSAAYRQGQLEAEDIILAVGQGAAEPVDITDTRLRDAVSLIRGKKGSEVRLTVRKSDGIRLVIPIVRDVVQIEETFVKSTPIKDARTGKTFGYLKIPSFYRDFKGGLHKGGGRNSTDDVHAELEKLKAQNISGLIVDLRNNGGGALTDAVSIAGLFIETGPVVQVRSSNGYMKILRDTDPAVVYDGPMIVLVNQFSASASEILAGAMQDYGRGIVIGSEHTHGKGTVQTILDLDRSIPLPNMDKYRPLGALKITTQKFYRVNGGSTQYRGVVPDIILPNRLQHLKSGEQYTDFSLPWDTVEPTRFFPWPGNGLFLNQLRPLSDRRTQTDEDFIEIREAARLAREKSEHTLQSLNIDDIRKERLEAKKHAKKSDSSPHGEGDEDEPADKNLSEAEKHIKWVKDTSEDPYVEEAMTVLEDLFAIAAPQAPAEVASPKNGNTPYNRQ